LYRGDAVLSFIQKLKQAITPPESDERRDLKFELNGKIFSRLRLHQRKSGETLSKVGLLGWVARMDQQPVKIYECRSESHAALIEKASADSMLRDFLPFCYMRIGRYLVVEWIRGRPLIRQKIRRDRDTLAKIAGLQALIHLQAQIIKEASCDFEYLDFLKARLERYKGIFPIDEAIQKVDTVLQDDTLSTKVCLSHADVTPSNLILEEGTGKLKIIDNELLTVNRYCLIDLYNTYYGLGRGVSSELVEYYISRYVKNGGDISPLVEQEQFYDALWHLRLIGSYLQNDAADKALQLARRYVQGNTEAHPLVGIAKGKVF
jgi:thiamine kinase-like enzyme